MRSTVMTEIKELAEMSRRDRNKNKKHRKFKINWRNVFESVAGKILGIGVGNLVKYYTKDVTADFTKMQKLCTDAATYVGSMYATDKLTKYVMDEYDSTVTEVKNLYSAVGKLKEEVRDYDDDDDDWDDDEDDEDEDEDEEDDYE